MATSTGVDLGEKKLEQNFDSNTETESGDNGSLPPSYDHTHRKLKSRHVQVCSTIT
jgi:amino acid permease